MEHAGIKIALAVIFGSGMLGLLTFIYIATFKKSDKSIDSSNSFLRLIYRYLIFSFGYLISFMLITPIINVEGLLSGLSKTNEGKSVIYMLSCIPVAIVIYIINTSLIRRWDRRKIAARASSDHTK